jgi:hypothetical protein
VCIVKHIEGWLKICSWIIARFGWMLFLRTIVTFSTSFYGWLPFWVQTKIREKNLSCSQANVSL